MARGTRRGRWPAARPRGRGRWTRSSAGTAYATPTHAPNAAAQAAPVPHRAERRRARPATWRPSRHRAASCARLAIDHAVVPSANPRPTTSATRRRCRSAPAPGQGGRGHRRRRRRGSPGSRSTRWMPSIWSRSMTPCGAGAAADGVGPIEHQHRRRPWPVPSPTGSNRRRVDPLLDERVRDRRPSTDTSLEVEVAVVHEAAAGREAEIAVTVVGCRRGQVEDPPPPAAVRRAPPNAATWRARRGPYGENGIAESTQPARI